MSGKDELDKTFKDALKNFEASPPAEVKHAIEEKLKEAGLLKPEKPRRKFLWLWFTFVVVTGVSAYFLMKTNVEPSHVTEKVNVGSGHQSTTASPSNEITVTRNDDKVLSKTDDVSPVQPAQASTGNGSMKDAGRSINSNGQVVNRGSSFSNPAASIHKQILPTHSVKNQTTQNLEKDASPAIAVVNNSSLEKVTKINSNQDKSSDGTSGANTTDDVNPVRSSPTAVSDQPLNKTESPQLPPDVSRNHETSQQRTDSTDVRKDQGADGISNSAMGLQNPVSNGITKSDSSLSTEKKILTDSVPKTLNPSANRGWCFFVDAIGGIEFPSIVFKSNDSGNDELRSNSENAEKPMNSPAFLLNMNVSYRNIILGAGIGHSIFQSTFEFNGIQKVADTSHSFRYTSGWDTSGTWVHVVDTSTIEAHVQSTNVITMFDFPIYVGYHHLFGHFEAEIRTGLMLSIISGLHSTVISAESNFPERYNGVQDSPFRKTYSSLYASALLGYTMSSHFAFLFQPYYTTSLNSVMNDYPVSRKIRKFGVGLGVRYNFN